MYEEPARRNVSFCGQSPPQLPDAVMATTPVLYYRFHGVPDLYRSPYNGGFLRHVRAKHRYVSFIKFSGYESKKRPALDESGPFFNSAPGHYLRLAGAFLAGALRAEPFLTGAFFTGAAFSGMGWMVGAGPYFTSAELGSPVR